MSGWIKFLALLTIVFFGVGEFAGGWHLGIPPQTPILVYKKSATNEVKRRTIMSLEFPFTVRGSLQRGSLTIEGVYERPESFQDQSVQPLPPQVFFKQTFEAGQPIRLSEVMKQGRGIYTVRLTFEDATGTVRVHVPNNSQL